MLKVVGETLHVGEKKNEYKKRVEKARIECFLGRSWQWLRADYLGKGTEEYVFAAQEQALRTRFFRATIEREDVDPKCRVCCKEVESVRHVASGCSGLVQRGYRTRHQA